MALHEPAKYSSQACNDTINFLFSPFSPFWCGCACLLPICWSSLGYYPLPPPPTRVPTERRSIRLPACYILPQASEMQMQVTVCKVCSSMVSFNHCDGSGAACAADFTVESPRNRCGRSSRVRSYYFVLLTKKELMYLYNDFHLHDSDIEIPWQNCIYTIVCAGS